MKKSLLCIVLAIALLAIGFFAGKTYAHLTVFNVGHYPVKYSGLYGIDAPCAEDPNDISVELVLIDYYRVKDRSCSIKNVEKVDGYFDLQPGANCISQTGYDPDDINTTTYDEVRPFRFSFKPLCKGKITARIDGKPDQIYTKCYLLRDRFDVE